MTSQSVQHSRTASGAVPAPGGHLYAAKRSSRGRLLLALVLLLSALYLAWELKRACVPSDGSTLAECSGRVRRGELGHRDYQTIS